MPKVLCTLPNASAEINGVAFTPADGGMLSEELSADRAAGFLAIPGYVEHAEEPAPAPAPVAVTPRPKKPAPVVPPAPPAVDPQPADGDADSIF